MRVRQPDQVRRWRKQRRYSQRELAMLCRCSQSAIHLIETGQLRNLTEDLAMNIASRLDVPWEDLFEEREAVPVPAATSGAHSMSQKVPA
jgi:putative transcriptional regulator